MARTEEAMTPKTNTFETGAFVKPEVSIVNETSPL